MTDPKLDTSFTDSVALTAMRTIYQNIRTACNEPENREARSAMITRVQPANFPIH